MPSESAVATAETRNFWQPDVTVATIVVRDGALLMVEEDVSGRRVLNQPAGHLEPDDRRDAAEQQQHRGSRRHLHRHNHAVGRLGLGQP